MLRNMKVRQALCQRGRGLVSRTRATKIRPLTELYQASCHWAVSLVRELQTSGPLHRLMHLRVSGASGCVSQRRRPHSNCTASNSLARPTLQCVCRLRLPIAGFTSQLGHVRHHNEIPKFIPCGTRIAPRNRMNPKHLHWYCNV
jgi:hypothetical protein